MPNENADIGFGKLRRSRLPPANGPKRAGRDDARFAAHAQRSEQAVVNMIFAQDT
jgi:hypothetical protein